MIKVHITAYFSGSKVGHLFEGWALIQRGAQWIIQCVGWVLIAGGSYYEGVRLIEA